MTPEVSVRLSLNVKAVIVGADEDVVFIVAVLLEVLPTCVEPLKDDTEKVPVKDFTVVIAFRSVVL